jgi:hypothetical protein
LLANSQLARPEIPRAIKEAEANTVGFAGAGVAAMAVLKSPANITRIDVCTDPGISCQIPLGSGVGLGSQGFGTNIVNW